MKDLVNAYPISKKHLVGFGVSFIFCVLFGLFNLMGWNDLWYLDEWFGFEIRINPFFCQTLIVFFMGFWANWLWEHFQQRNLEEKPTKKDTYFDTLYFMISSYLGFLFVELLLVIFN
jgi:hypothetical protein